MAVLFGSASFPEELYVRIFRNLDLKSKCRVACVCRSWQAAASSHALWHNIDLDLVRLNRQPEKLLSSGFHKWMFRRLAATTQLYVELPQTDSHGSQNLHNSVLVERILTQAGVYAKVQILNLICPAGVSAAPPILQLVSWRNLTVLRIAATMSEDPTFLTQLTGLRALQLQHCSEDDSRLLVMGLSGLTSLTFLRLVDILVTHAGLASCTALRTLRLVNYYHSAMAEDVNAPIRQLNLLTALAVKNDNLACSLLSLCGTSLRRLSIGQEEATDSVGKPLSSCFCAELLQRCTGLELLEICHHSLADWPSLDDQCRFVRLSTLRLQDCELECLPATLAAVATLIILDLDCNNLCRIPRCLAMASCLTRLSLEDSQVQLVPGDAALLGSMVRLKHLRLGLPSGFFYSQEHQQVLEELAEIRPDLKIIIT